MAATAEMEAVPTLASCGRAVRVLTFAAAMLGAAALALRPGSSAAGAGSFALARSSAPRMLTSQTLSCGGGLCGFLVLETGEGDSFYKHPTATVHGLWPQVSPYGDSTCVKPGSSSDMPSGWLPSCYDSESARVEEARILCRCRLGAGLLPADLHLVTGPPGRGHQGDLGRWGCERSCIGSSGGWLPRGGGESHA